MLSAITRIESVREAQGYTFAVVLYDEKNIGGLPYNFPRLEDAEYFAELGRRDVRFYRQADAMPCSREDIA